MTHCLEINKSLARQRLIPSAICSLLTLIHFHSVVWTSPTSYPLTNYVPCVVESILLAVIALTISLNALTQLLLEGRISRPLFGHSATLMPKLDEDFSVVLFRLGTASMEVTSVAGMSNEAAGIAVSDSQSDIDKLGGMVEINRTGYVGVSSAVGAGGKSKRGLANEIKRVKAKTNGPSGDVLGMDSIVDVRWQREMGRFVYAAFRLARAMWRAVWALARGRALQLHENERVPHGEQPFRPAVALVVRAEDDGEIDVYERFLRGDNVSDDDGDEDEFDPLPEVQQPGSRRGTPLELSEDDEDDEDDPNETLQLFSDLSAPNSNSTPRRKCEFDLGAPRAYGRYRVVPAHAEALHTTTLRHLTRLEG